jgi:hypothetical protein
MKDITYFNGPCGSGKTYIALGQANKYITQQNRSVCIVAPHKGLVDQLHKDCMNRFTTLHVKPFHSDIEDSVCERIAANIEANERPHLMLITQAAWMMLRNWQCRSQWAVFFDEQMELIRNLSVNSPDAAVHTLWCSFLEQFANRHESILRPASTDMFTWMRDNNVESVFKQLSETLSNPNFTVRFNEADFQKYIARESSQLKLWADFDIARFKGYYDIQVYGAQIEKSLMMQYITLSECFHAKPSNLKGRYSSHEQPLLLRWSVDRSLASITFNRKTKGANKTTNGRAFMSLVCDSLNGEKALVHANATMSWPTRDNLLPLKHKVEGINNDQFQSVHHYAEAGAYNYKPEMVAILRDEYGFNAEKLQLQRSVDHIYQGGMRGSMRRGTFHQNVWYVQTKAQAELIKAEFFPNAFIERLNGAAEVFGERRVAKTSTEKSRKSRTIKSINDLIARQSTTAGDVTLSVFAAVNKRHVHEAITFASFDDMAAFFEDVNTLYDYKEDALLFMNAALMPESTGKTQEITAFNPVVVMDVDKSSITPHEFAASLPGVRLVVMPSFNHAKDGNNKFRALISLDRAASDAHMASCISQVLLDKCNDLCINYGNRCEILTSAKTHIFEIDAASCKPAQLYFLPGINREFEAASFFINQAGNPICVDELLKIFPDRPPATIVPLVIERRAILQPIITRCSATGKGRRNSDYCKIIGYIQHNRQQFTDDLIETAFQMWKAVDPDRTRLANFKRAI